MYLENELNEIFNKDNYLKIISRDRRSNEGCQPYKSIKILMQPNIVTPEEITIRGENNYYDVLSCRELLLDDESVTQLTTHIGEYIQGEHSLPLVEIAREYSNLVLILETSIPYTNGMYKIHDEGKFKSILNGICKCVYKDMKCKTTSNVCVLVRAYKNKVYFKLHFVDYLMDINSKVYLARKVSDLIESYGPQTGDLIKKIYPIKYNEICFTSVLPRCSGPLHWYWDIYTTIECSRFMSVNITDVGRSKIIELCNSEGNSFAILSINSYDTIHKKQLHIISDAPKYEVLTAAFKDEMLLMSYINKNSRLCFLDIILRNIPTEMKQPPLCDNIIYSLKVENSENYAITYMLASYHFQHLGTEYFNKLWYNRHKRSMLGFYASVASLSPTYRAEIDKLIEWVLENEFYSSKGSISDTAISQILNIKHYGKFISFDVPNGKDKPFKTKLMFVDKNDAEDERMLYKWVPYDEPRLLELYITDNLTQTMTKVIDSMGFTPNSYSKDPRLKAMSKKYTAFINSRDSLKSERSFKNIISKFTRETRAPLLNGSIDADRSVIGVLNGILDMNLSVDDPKPVLYEGYSPYIVTKTANAEYIPYEIVKHNGKYINFIKSIIKDVIVEKDARKKILFIMSTAIEDYTIIEVILMVLGWGRNGKSTLFDFILDVVGSYGRKLSSALLTNNRRSGQADPEFMDLKNHRMGLIAETNKNDKLVASRLKSVTEKVKDGRGLFRDNENFASQVTCVLCSNYPLELDDFDYGTTRRILVYYTKSRFVENPDPTDPSEKQINPEISTILNTQVARDEMFSWLVHLRCKFQRQYKSNIHVIQSETIDKYTSEYRCSKDLLSKFIHQRIIIMLGYTSSLRLRQNGDKSKTELREAIDIEYENSDLHLAQPHEVSMINVVQEYCMWAKRTENKDINEGYNNILNVFKVSTIGKYIIGDDDIAKIEGIRVLEYGKQKLKDEMHFKSRN